jgi:spermidine synthase
MLAQVREPLLGILRTSPDFRPAYDPLFAMASALAASDPAAARELLEDLGRAQPDRIEAADALARLNATRP